MNMIDLPHIGAMHDDGNAAMYDAHDADDAYHVESYRRGDYGTLYWRGRRMLKCPVDIWIWLEILAEVRPQLIIETGTYEGASALFFADMAAVHDPGVSVITIDIARDGQWVKYVKDRRVTYMEGRSSLDSGVLSFCKRTAGRSERTLVILDSDHSAPHVLKEMDVYAGFVTPGSYLIVEDSNIAGHPVQGAAPADERGGGPMAAIEAWLPAHSEFTPDPHRERFGVTFNPKGWLRRLRLE